MRHPFRPRLPSWVRPLLAVLLLAAFGSNSTVPGLLHGCAAKVDGQAPSAMEGMHHGAHDAHQDPAPAQTCACVDHGCCSVGLVAVTTPVLAVAATIPVVQPSLTTVTRVALITPEFLQPYPVGPPSLD